jgi:PAS domain S-box-containing protein
MTDLPDNQDYKLDYNRLIENINDGFFVVDENENIIYCNKALSRIFGVTHGELTGKSLLDFVPESQIILLRKETEKRKRGESSNYQLQIIRPNGESRILSIAATPDLDENGTYKATIIVCRNITKLINIEKELRSARNYFKAILDNLLDPVLIHEFDGRIIEANYAATQHFGCSYEVLTSSTLYDFMPQHIQEIRPQKLAQLIENRVIVFDSFHVNKSGEIIPVEAKSSIIELNGREVILSISRNISERLKTENDLRVKEAHFRAIFDNLPFYSWFKDEEGKYLLVNKTLAELSPEKDPDKLIGKNDHDVFPDDLAYRHLQNDIEVMTQGKKISTEEHLEINGEDSWIEIHNAPIIDNDGNVLGTTGIARDITERKILEKKIQDELDLNIKIIEASPLGKAAYNCNGDCVFVNTSFCKILGIELDKMQKLTLKESIICLTSTIYDEFKFVMETDKKAYGEILSESYDGREIWLDYIIVPFTKNNTPHGLITIIDRTESKKLKNKLRELSDTYERLTLNAGEAIYRAEADTGQIIFLNPAAEQLLGYRLSEFQEDSSLSFKILHPDSIETSINIIEMLKSGKKIVKNQLLTWITRKGQHKLMEFTFIPVRDESKYVRTYEAIGHDVTEAKRFEEILKNNEKRLLYSEKLAHLGSWEVNLKSGESYWSDEIYRIYGLMVGEIEPSNEIMKKFIHPDDLEEYTSRIEDSISGSGMFEFEHRIIRVDGSVRYVITSNEVLFDENNKANKLMGFIQDVTIDKIHENEKIKLIDELQISHDKIEEEAKVVQELNLSLSESSTQLKELNASKDRFFSIIAHDLRSPLSSFLMLTEMMTKEVYNLSFTELSEFLSELNINANRLNRLLNNLLEWSRIQNGAIPFNPENLSLRDAIDIPMDILMSNASTKKIELLNNSDENIFIFADLNMINTIVRNFVSNALKFTNEGGHIDITSVVLDNDMVEICIKDDGIGMTDEIRRKLFKIDEKIISIGTKGEPGTGLGLVLCKEFVDKHHGKIRVESRLGKGTSFYFTVPSKDIFTEAITE